MVEAAAGAGMTAGERCAVTLFCPQTAVHVVTYTAGRGPERAVSCELHWPVLLAMLRSEHR